MKSLFKKPLYLGVYIVLILCLIVQVTFFLYAYRTRFGLASYTWINFVLALLLIVIVILTILQYRKLRKLLMYSSLFIFLYALVEIAKEVAFIINKGTITGLDSPFHFILLFEMLLLFFLAKDGMKLVE